jgi:FtsZ-interacting cell division protein ZipA
VVVEASITGIFRTILIVVGAIVLLRFLGQFMIAKRNMEEERKHAQRNRMAEKERDEKLKNFGKTNVITKSDAQKQKSSHQSTAEDVDFEEIS